MRSNVWTKLVVGTVATMIPAGMVVVAQSSQAAGCGVYAGTPSAKGAGQIGGVGGRSGCGSSTRVEVKLRWDRPFAPDPTIDQRSGSYTNVELYVQGGCLVGYHDYYIDTNTDTGQYSTSDPRRNASCA